MSFVYGTYRIEVALAGYRSVILADSPVGYWRLDAVSGAIENDISGGGWTATISGGVTLNQAGALLGDSDTAMLFDGTNGTYVETNAAFSPAFGTGPMSVEFWFKTTSALAQIGIIDDKNAGSNDAGFNVAMFAGQFLLRIANGATQEGANSVGTFNDGAWHHFVGVLTRGAPDTLKIYIDGTLNVSTNLATSGRNITQVAHKLRIGAYSTGGSPNFYVGTLDEVAIYASALTPAQVLAHYRGMWTSLGLDVSKVPAPHFFRGAQQNGPLDHVAAVGLLDFELRNDARNSGGIQGWYSPNHASCRSGWTFGIPIRVVSSYQSATLGDAAAVDRVLWTGKVKTILPAAGKYRTQRVAVTAQDAMGDLADNETIQIAPQLNQTEDALIQAVLSAMPSTAQPPATSLDPGVDIYPYAFDNIGSGVKAMSAITDVTLSAYGWVYVKADGTLRYENRHTRALKTSQFTFTELLHDDLTVPSDLQNVFNRVRVTIHPRTIDAAASTVICAATGTITIAPGQTVTVWDTYRDPTNTLKLIGGTAFVTPLVAATDYVANAASDGSGADLTTSISIVVTAFAATAKFDITNSHPTATAYVTKRQMRGKGIYDNGPVTFETYLAKSYGDRPLDVDLLYQTDPVVAAAFADYIAQLYSSQMNQADDLLLNPQRSDALLTQALTREIGDLITDSETMTGVSAALFAIVGIEMTIEPGQILTVRYRVAYAGSGLTFIFDDATHGVFDSAASPLGYA
jgi:hypothetical protein